jgi:hypothetical protein
MIDFDPSKLDNSILIIADNTTELDIALKKYGLENQDGAVFSAISDIVGRKIIVVKKFDDYVKAAAKYLAGFG